MLLKKISRLKDGRYLLELGDGGTIKTTASVMAEYALYEGMEAGEGEFKKIAEASAAACAAERAARIAGARQLSKGELVEKLVGKGEDPDASLRAAERMEELGAVDDLKYAEAVVRHYAARCCGEKKIKDELYRRRVPRELWEEALLRLPDMSGALDAYLEKALGGGKAGARALSKAAEALYRRGFSSEEIRSAVSRYQAEHGCDGTEGID